jgi:hypothetical protein
MTVDLRLTATNTELTTLSPAADPARRPTVQVTQADFATPKRARNDGRKV